MLAVPPVIPRIHRDLHLDYSAIGVLTGLPTFLLAAAAIPGALLIARMGARRALLIGMAGVAVASALRGVGPHTAVLYTMTLVVGAGVAVSQPAFPTLVGEWLPARIAFATAVYTNGMIMGETVPAAATGSVVLPAVGGSWEVSLVAWAAPVAALLALVALTTREPVPRRDGPPARRLPDFSSRQLWLVGLVFGMASAAYWGANTFIPDFAHASGRPQLQDAALASLNASQLAASLLALALPGLLMGRRWPFVAMGILLAAAFAGIAFAPGAWLVVSAGVVGFASALGLVLTLALPPLLAAPAEVHTFSAGVFVICYLTAFVGPVLGGAAWDLSHVPRAPFLVLGCGGLVAIALAAVTSYRPRGERISE